MANKTQWLFFYAIFKDKENRRRTLLMANVSTKDCIARAENYAKLIGWKYKKLIRREDVTEIMRLKFELEETKIIFKEKKKDFRDRLFNLNTLIRNEK